MIKDVQYPRHLFKGIQPLMSDNPLPKNLKVFGGDTETVRGNPHTIQIVGPDGYEILKYVTKKTIFSEFWGEIRAQCRVGGVNICYFHNLNFDLRVLFALNHLDMYEQYNDISFRLDYLGRSKAKYAKPLPSDVEIKMLFGKVNKCDIKQGKVKLSLFDSKAFTQCSLSRALKMFKIPESKLPMPKGLGKDWLHTKEFEAYAMADARAERALGLRIMEFHAKYKVRPSITLPTYSARVFKRYSLRAMEEIPFPPMDIVKAAELSYHGGKNGYYLENPEVIEDLFEVDISSAYPHAMSELPGMTKGVYLRVEKFVPDLVGIYSISGKTGNQIYPVIFTHLFEKVGPDTEFKDTWITSYELTEIMKYADTDFEISYGYVWVPDKDAVNPFARYVDHFYKLKESTDKDDPYYQFYKIMLNGLYGKLVSTVEIKSQHAAKAVEELQKQGIEIPDNLSIDERKDPVTGEVVRISKYWQAGSMYNPFWATLITGRTRTYIYELERKTNAVHTATDSVKSLQSLPSKKGLGGLKVETYGRCYLFRNKLYLHCAKGYDICGHKEAPYKYPKNYPNTRKRDKPILDTDGQHLCKVALHGFKGSVSELWDARHSLLRDKELSYKYTHVVGLREGLRRRENVCDFVKRPETLKL